MIRKLILLLCLPIVACAPISTSAIPPISPTDAELDAAMRQARDSLNEFVVRLGTPHAERTFAAVKVRFYPPDETPQEIWVDEVTYENDIFRGNVGDDIPGLKLEMGETITVNKEDIVDWMIVEEGKLIGGYTIRLAVQRMSAEERQRFLETLDYSIED